ncbi:MAG: type II toxin-antitoxin system Phd/YefM family antitoxin [Candidatus Omnitrophica bacterium]|nr:type II toxin-antitoxin system Phd/YefM family antitoxin [Candidatus Omnitrophota bacterium]
MTTTVTLKELRPSLPKIIDRIDGRLDRYFITKRGKPVVVMLSVDDYESLMETLDILADKDTMKRVRLGEKEVRSGKTRSWSDLKRSLEKL